MTKRKRSVQKRSMVEEFSQSPNSIVSVQCIATFLTDMDLIHILRCSRQWNKEWKMAYFNLLWLPIKHYSSCKDARNVCYISTMAQMKSLTSNVIGLHANRINFPLPRLPPFLDTLRLGYGFNQPLHDLPSTLIELELGCTFNQPLPNLPPKLRHLSLGNSFNHPLPHLPESLLVLKLGECFDQNLLCFPPQLKKIVLRGFCFKKLPPWPSSLTKLTWSNFFAPLTWPASLEHLKWRYNSISLPANLSNLPSTLITLNKKPYHVSTNSSAESCADST